ncbi:MAG: hypothetical protein M3R38_15535 [Actinomycetota bacterium]|nr:hypothetical protein [Actinomycetota bacterium]
MAFTLRRSGPAVVSHPAEKVGEVAHPPRLELAGDLEPLVDRDGPEVCGLEPPIPQGPRVMGRLVGPGAGGRPDDRAQVARETVRHVFGYAAGRVRVGGIGGRLARGLLFRRRIAARWRARRRRIVRAPFGLSVHPVAQSRAPEELLQDASAGLYGGERARDLVGGGAQSGDEGPFVLAQPLDEGSVCPEVGRVDGGCHDELGDHLVEGGEEVQEERPEGLRGVLAGALDERVELGLCVQDLREEAGVVAVHSDVVLDETLGEAPLGEERPQRVEPVRRTPRVA